MHVLECDQGDTILVHFPGNKWALIDCHLPEGRIRKKFFEFVQKHGIDRLHLLMLTHPDRDHFHGMGDVIDYFTRDGRTINAYCDSGVDVKHIRSLIRSLKSPQAPEYEEIQRKLDAIIRESTQYFQLRERSDPIEVEGFEGKVRLIPVAPDDATFRTEMRSGIRKSQDPGSLNAISLVLLLQVRDNARDLCILLAGDANPTGLTRALTIWERHAENKAGAMTFDAIKVSHHGSGLSHLPRLCAMPRSGSQCVAAISVGTKYRKQPDRAVMRDYLTAGWTVLLTTKRIVRSRNASPLLLFGRSNREYDLQQQDIRITWDPCAGLGWDPKNAAIAVQELEDYETALAPSR